MDKRRIIFWSCSLAVAACLVAFAHRWDRAIRSYELRFAAAGETEKAASESEGRIFLDNDAYYWVGYAREMAKTGKWRIRHTYFDNPPDGRPAHWSQSVSWLLLLTGSLRHIVTGETLHAAVENAAIWIGPLQYFILIVGAGLLLCGRLGLVPALVWMLNLATILSVGWSFHPMRPDHHGLQLGFFLSSLLCLILGGLGWTAAPSVVKAPALSWFRALDLPDKRRARRFFIASGVLGGLGLWTGASVQLFGVGLSAAGALLLVLFMPSSFSESPGVRPVYEPSLWRWWAVTGAGTALLFYWIEYAPAFPGMRLEVNHPLHAVSWLCVGEALVRLSAGKTRGRPSNPLLTGLFCLGAALLPALLAFGPTGWHAMRDPLMQRLHRFIDEFRPYRAAYPGACWRNAFRDFGLLPLFLVPAPWLAREERSTLHEWAALWMAFLASLVYAALTLWQARWMNFFAVSSLLLAVITLAILWRHQIRKGRVTAWFYVLVAALVGQSAWFLGLQFRDIHVRDISRVRVGELISPMLQRQFAEKLGAMDTNHAFRVMGGPHMAARLQYYGHVPSVASYYWENLEGLRAAADFFAAENDEAALRVVEERGITHVVLPPSADIARMFYYIKNGYFSEAGARDSLAGRLLARPEALPRWIRRDMALERALQPGYRFAGEPVFGTLLMFTIRQDRFSADAGEP